MADPEKFELAIPSNTTIAQEVQERIIAELEKRNYTSRDVFGVRLSLEEAITNAIRHGNGNDESLMVKINCEISDDLMRVVVTDQGEGFTPSDVPDPTADENLELAGGRGVLLMEAYMSKVEYNEKGNQVILEKIRTVESAE
jgi:serine/threonine-protein kinase RsbW